MSWHIYIAQTRASKYYTGISQDPPQRIKIHNQGNGAKIARDQGLLHLLYMSKSFATKSEARKREIQIKGWTKMKKEKLIRGEWK